MGAVLQGLDYTFCYVDDILVASNNPQQHKAHLREVLRRLQDYGLSINLAKCIIGANEIRYLGYLINGNGIATLQDRVEAIANYPKPKTITELRRFLGLINFYHRFVRNAAATQTPLHSLTAGATKRDKRPVAWNPEAEQSFKECKQQLANAALLAHPQERAPLALHTDASDLTIGATLEQFQH
ncbi:unnamed protein product [Lasius platythorax]|uniref:Reverse transcriptase domain-containing protein n=1 Tax=Lasius platythorax TaxID=488582 RepID=A0AAV2NN39_9HYME